MQNVAWPTAAKISDFTLNVLAHSRGGAGRGGHYSFERGAGAFWQGELDVTAMAASDALSFRAFLHSLRGRGGTFLLPLPAPIPNTVWFFTDGTGFDDGTGFFDDIAHGALAANAAADAETITVSAALAGSALAVVGAYVVLGDIRTTGQLLRLTAVSGTIWTIRPRLRQAHASGADVAVGRVTGKFRLAGETPAVPLNGHYCPGLQVAVIEVY